MTDIAELERIREEERARMKLLRKALKKSRLALGLIMQQHLALKAAYKQQFRVWKDAQHRCDYHYRAQAEALQSKKGKE